MLIHWSADHDDHVLGEGHARGVAGGTQPPTDRRPQDLSGSLFLEGHLAAQHLRDEAFVDVEEHHLETAFSKRETQWQAYVATTSDDHHVVHVRHSSGCPLCSTRARHVLGTCSAPRQGRPTGTPRSDKIALSLVFTLLGE